MKRIGGALFCFVIALVLGAVSLLTGSGVLNAMRNIWHTSDWVQAQADVIGADLVATPDRKTIRYRATATYLYDFGGRKYQSREITPRAFSGGEDSGGFHKEMGERLKAAKEQKRPITIWVNPKNPSEAVIDKSTRWGLILALVPFAVVFGLLSLLLLYAAWRYLRSPGDDAPKVAAAKAVATPIEKTKRKLAPGEQE